MTCMLTHYRSNNKMAQCDRQNAGGYDYKFLEDPPDSLKCLICLLVVRDPQQHGDCGRLFCNSCITEYKQGNNTCPYCRGALTTFSDGKSALEVKSLKVQCENTDCPWQGELRSLTKHLDGCDYIPVPCPNKCNKEYLAKKDLELHLKSECLRREYECPYCEAEGEYEEMTTTHLEECDDFELECSNLGCEDMIPRWKLPTHQSKCDYQPVSCKYAEVGCGERPLRKDLKKHEEDAQLHLQMTMNRVLELNKEVAKLGLQLSAKDKQITDLEKKIRNDSLFKFKVRRVQNTEEVQSPSFYTSRAGYKMCVKVYTKGRGDSKHTHLSVYAYLMKGDNDDSLTWPFTGTVTIELLNQLEDKNHYKLSVTFTADNEVSKRVVIGEKGRGWGHPQFISLTALDYEPDKNRQFLKDDTLVLQISVCVSDYKPWLECDN